MSFVAPTGIPVPSFGVEEEVEMYLNPAYTYDYGSGAEPYRVANGKPYTYFIQPTHPSATDTGNPHGSPSVPRLTWPASLVAGDCLQLIGVQGTFSTGNNRQQIMGSGTAELPIFVYGISGTTSTIMGRSGQLYVFGNYTIIEDLRFGDGSINVRLSTRPELKLAPVIGVVVRDCFATGTGATTAATWFSTGGSDGASEANYTEHVVLLRNTVSAYGNWQAPTENDACGVIASQFASQIWVLYNEMFNFGGDSIRIGADQGDDPSGGFYYIGGNHFYDNRENGIDIKQARNSVISENIIHGFLESSSSEGEAIVSHYDPQNIWIINNQVYDCITGYISTGASGQSMYILGNVWWNCSDVALYPDRGGGTFYVYSNTIANSGHGIQATGSIAALNCRDNIVANCSGFYLQVSNSTTRAASSVSNELYYGENGSVSISWGSTYTSVAAWISGTTVGDNSLQQDPLFVNEPQNNYRLRASSPAIGTGLNWGSLDATFKASFGNDVTILFDISGNARPTDGSWEIGAYEYNANILPNAPTNLRLVSQTL